MSEPIKGCCYDFKQRKCVVDFSEQLKTACVFVEEVPKDSYVPPPPPPPKSPPKKEKPIIYVLKNLFKGVKF